ncbi:MAG: response regulator [Rhodomicrobium sp.]
MGKRILIVEDNALLALELGQGLEHAGFETVGPATSVEQALSLLDTRGCDAAVLDINLRGGTSEPVAHGLKARSIPFVTITGYAQGQLPAVFEGVPNFTKPVRLPLVAAELRRRLGLAAD